LDTTVESIANRHCNLIILAGGWGKPPVDEYGKPLYGDVFGLNVCAECSFIIEKSLKNKFHSQIQQINDVDDESRIERRHWGEIASEDEESEEESDVEEEEPEDGQQAGAGRPAAPPESGFVTPAPTEG
jgi:splicing factor 3B subunit 2